MEGARAAHGGAPPREAPVAARGAEAAVARLSGGRRVPELDGLRGVAILLVVVWHYFGCMVEARPGSPLAYAMTAFRMTWSGVDLFLVLSGFLIGGILLDVKESPNYFATFYTRRVYRIFPLYYLYFALFCAAYLTGAASTAGPTAELWKNPLPLWSYALFLQNFHMAAHGDTGPRAIGMTWSLAVEEQFYLVFPLLVRFLPRRAIAWTLALVVLAAPLLRVILYYGAHLNLAPYVLMPCRADALGLGALLAFLFRDPWFRERLSRVSNRPLLLPGALLAVALAFLTFKNAGAGTALAGGVGQSVLAVSYGWLLVVTLSGRAAVLERVLRGRLLQVLGRLSYGIYIYHEAVNGLCHAALGGRDTRINDAASLALTLVAIVATVAVAELSFRFFEAPLLRRGHAHVYGKREDRLTAAAG